MKLPEYVTIEEVQRVCGEMGLQDWTVIGESPVTYEEAAIILKIANTEGMDIPVETFRMGLEVELEHGIRFKDANVTNNHPVLTGKIVLAHLKETMDYYHRLDVAEMEGDLLKAISSGDIAKAQVKYKKIISAQQSLNRAVEERLK
ncbi:MAG: DUF5661 family protein [Thermovirgaceae bacterium]|nr:DUF5661 family protein [Thermovirgaceae bacterium]